MPTEPDSGTAPTTVTVLYRAPTDPTDLQSLQVTLDAPPGVVERRARACVPTEAPIDAVVMSNAE